MVVRWWAVWAGWAVWAALGMMDIYPTKTGCVDQPEIRMATCNLTNWADRHARLETPSNLNDYRIWNVIGALSLVIMFKCEDLNINTELSIQNCENVRTEQTQFKQCKLNIKLDDSRAKDISHGVKVLRLEQNSRAEKIALDEVEELRVEDSHVEEMNIVVTNSTTIINSVLTDVKKLDMVGDSLFQTEGSVISTMRSFNYRSSNTKSRMNDVIVKHVVPNGFIISGGIITLENVTFENLDTNAIIIRNGARVVIRSSTIINVLPDSWIIENGSTVFVDVLLTDKPSFSSPFSGTSLSPLRLVLDCPHSPGYWVAAVASVLALLLGFLVGGAVMYIVCQKKGHYSHLQSKTEEKAPVTSNAGKETKHIARNHVTTSKTPPPSQNESLEENYDWYEDVQEEAQKRQPLGNFPGVPRPPLPQPPRSTTTVPQNDDDNDEVYEDVSDLNQNPSVQTPASRGIPTASRPTMPFRPSPAFPHSSSASTGIPPRILGPPLPTRKPPSSRPPVPITIDDPSKFSVQSSSSSVMDERDILPPQPQPLDDQEVYEDPDTIFLNPVFPSGNKPSFLHNTSPAKSNVPLKPSIKSKPLVGMMAKFSSKKSQPPKPPPSAIPAPPTNKDDDDEGAYEEI
ncbi:hypothetical protein Pcinc_033268 [Petrolisthes cinctipes]|uniref:Uncharacterized protein n=1 Tax=Petrolisthes cinctipes TaxID=88211 RepID=A0AAE1ESM2_PETCI|nr:hypothetical protein Pcinc_033268 [Petrolisthes cinctipes]